MKRATVSLITLLTVALATGCAATTNDRLSAPASTWLSAEIAAARTAATQGNYREAVTDLAAIEASVHTFRSQDAIDAAHAARILAAVARARAALSPYVNAHLGDHCATGDGRAATRREWQARTRGEGRRRGRLGRARCVFDRSRSGTAKCGYRALAGTDRAHPSRQRRNFANGVDSRGSGESNAAAQRHHEGSAGEPHRERLAGAPVSCAQPRTGERPERKRACNMYDIGRGASARSS